MSSLGENSIPIKNSFIHLADPAELGPARPRTLSAPAIVHTQEPPVVGVEADHQMAWPLPPPVIQFRGDIFYTVFVSPVCERSAPKLPTDTRTVMVRNIPTRFTSVSFLRILDECGFRGSYDFFYLPMDFRTGKNMGYCFINFVHGNFTLMFAR